MRNKRNYLFNFKLSEEELKKLKQMSEEKGLKASEFVRQKLFSSDMALIRFNQLLKEIRKRRSE